MNGGPTRDARELAQRYGELLVDDSGLTPSQRQDIEQIHGRACTPRA